MPRYPIREIMNVFATAILQGRVSLSLDQKSLMLLILSRVF